MFNLSAGHTSWNQTKDGGTRTRYSMRLHNPLGHSRLGRVLSCRTGNAVISSFLLSGNCVGQNARFGKLDPLCRLCLLELIEENLSTVFK